MVSGHVHPGENKEDGTEASGGSGRGDGERDSGNQRSYPEFKQEYGETGRGNTRESKEGDPYSKLKSWPK